MRLPAGDEFLQNPCVAQQCTRRPDTEGGGAEGGMYIQGFTYL